MAAALTAWFAEGLRHWGRVIGALTLCACLLIGGCATAAGLSGNYEQDTVTVADALIATIALPAEDPGRADAETSARSLINDYMARYRPRREVNGLASFTTMQTALNSLAGHYSNYPNRPVPEALKDRVTRELQKAEAGVVRGA
ncbi:photosystem II protein Psb27 [Synechococcus sp. GFB01]|jgi:photosystem II Psb27 protein|uniref:photosystem II protein Psb27 n=1 Tax=Synechococcus sp. GFB01 TaxID=1662190 RepID=UPI00064FD61E|nr:photosystem II protein Psb27 [Synechococcus sp. GFB01]KMM16572.1 Photosystem II protein [Synechococcus sp. GFB01]